jgi:hypothetical protein
MAGEVELDTIAILNQLLNLHRGSLPMYLESAPPHRGNGDEKAAEVLSQIVEDQKLMVDRIATYITEKGGPVALGEFPMEFTDLHDLSMDYILGQVMSRQSNEIEIIEQLSRELADDPWAKSLAQEALGAAKAHLQSLEECMAAA